MVGGPYGSVGPGVRGSAGCPWVSVGALKKVKLIRKYFRV